MQIRGNPGRNEQERYFDLGFAAPVPRLVDPDYGITNVVQIADASYDVDATIMDAPDQRLVRSGVTLAKRSFNQASHGWYLDAPDWAPWLPIDKSLDDERAPVEFGNAVLPFLRRAELIESAHLHCRRRTWNLRDAERVVVARLRDDQVTISRDGVVTGRYREVTLTPLFANQRQVSWLTESLLEVGATRVATFPTLAERLGAPAMGPSDLPPVSEWHDHTPAPEFVRTVLSARLRELIGADLALRSQMTTDISKVVGVLRRLRREIRGLAPILDAEWVAESDAALAQVTANIADSPTAPASTEYLAVIDRVVSAARSDHLVTVEQTAGDLARALIANAVTDARKVIDDLSPNAPQSSWEAAVAQAEALVDTCAIADLLPLTRNRRFTRRAVRLAERLRATRDPKLAKLRDRVAGMTAEEAFDAGRAYARREQAQAEARREFLADWPKRRRKMVVG